MRFIDGQSNLVNMLLNTYDQHVGHTPVGKLAISSLIHVGIEALRDTDPNLINASPANDPNGFFDPVFLSIAEIGVALLDGESLPSQYLFLHQLTKKDLLFDSPGIRQTVQTLDLLFRDSQKDRQRFISQIALRTNDIDRLTHHIGELQMRLVACDELKSHATQVHHRLSGGCMSLVGLLLSTSLIFVALWVVLCGFDIVTSHRHLQRLGIITEAQIVRISQQSVMSQNSQGLTQREHQAFEIVRFTLKDNTSFETPLRFDVKPDIKAPRTTGSRVMVAYNPDNPKEVIDISTVRAQWQGWLALGLGLMTGGLALFGLLICCRHLWFASTAIKAFSLLSLTLISLIASRLTWQFWEDSLALNFTSTLVSETVSSGGLILTANNMQPFTGTLKEESLAVTTLTRYHQGKRHGLAQNFLKGRLVAFETYHDDIRVGPFQHTDDYGRKTATGHFNGGHLDGDYLGFNPTTEHIIEKGRWRWGDKDGTWTYYHSNGSLAIEEHYLNGQLEGGRKEYDEHGNLLLQAHYVQGQLNGLYIKYWPNGQKAVETNMAHGQPNGVYTTFHQDGTIETTGIKQNGQWITAPTAYGSDGITNDDEPSITIRELTPEEAQTLEAAANTTKQATDWLEKENLREDSRADASNNAYAPFDKAITGLLENALKKWGGLETDNLPGLERQTNRFQFGSGRSRYAAWAYLFYPEEFVLTVTVGTPDEGDPPVAIKGLQRVQLNFDPIQLANQVRDNFVHHHPDLQLNDFVIQIDWRKSGT